MERGMKWGVRQVSWERPTTEAIKRMKFARGPALPEVSTSAGLISDLHHYHSPVFPSPSSARTCGGRDVTLMSARVLSVDKLPTILWRDKLSRLIISLSLTARQLIKAPQGTRLHNFFIFLWRCEASDGGASLRWRAEREQTGEVKKRSWCKLAFMTEHAPTSQ